MPEERHLRLRRPAQLPRAPLPDTPEPPTVSHPRLDAPPQELSLDEAVRIALANSEVIRVLAGVTAVSSGQTIYDTPAASTAIDQQRGRFDPDVSARNNWNRVETPLAFEDPLDPLRTLIGGTRTDDYDLNFELGKITTGGGRVALRINENTARFRPGIFRLSPRDRHSLDMSVTQPLLQGGGRAANLAPIVLARIDTERSYFQFKGSVQNMVRGVIEAYWALVFARTDLWARQQQVDQSQFAYNLTKAQEATGISSGGDVAQTRLALANFKASLVAAKANVLQREAALRNILGLPPYAPDRMTPVTPPTKDRLDVDWPQIVSLAEQFRPDLIELKLILEADQQLLLQADNQALPRVDAVALYRWNGLDGRMPDGGTVSSVPGQHTDWTLGVNFSVPLGLRAARAQLRQRELFISRDRANLQQGLHSSIHLLALSVRNLDQFYEQYLAFGETRAAARINLEQQMARYRAGVIQYINVLQAIVDWGNAVSSEAQSLAQYNTELATLERETGTILETHGIRFFEERFGAIGPLGRLANDRCYPEALPPSENESLYPDSGKPAEEFFQLEDPLQRLHKLRTMESKQWPPLPTGPLPPAIPAVPETLPPIQQPESVVPPAASD